MSWKISQNINAPYFLHLSYYTPDCNPLQFTSSLCSFTQVMGFTYLILRKSTLFQEEVPTQFIHKLSRSLDTSNGSLSLSIDFILGKKKKKEDCFHFHCLAPSICSSTVYSFSGICSNSSFVWSLSYLTAKTPCSSWSVWLLIQQLEKIKHP